MADVCVLILLALIFKFAQAGGTFGFLTGGVLALYVITVIVGDTSQNPTIVTTAPTQPPPPSHKHPSKGKPRDRHQLLPRRLRLRVSSRKPHHRRSHNPPPLHPSPGRSSRPAAQSSNSLPAFRTI